MDAVLVVRKAWPVMALLCGGIAFAQPHDHMPGAPPEEEATGLRVSVSREADWAPWLMLGGRYDLLPLARRALQQPDPVIRRRGLFLLGCLMIPEGAYDAQRCTGDKDALVRMQAAVTLAMLRRYAGLDGAAEALRRGPDWLKFYAIYGMWRLNESVAREQLRGNRRGLSGFLRKTADAALSNPLPQVERQSVRAPVEKTPASLYDLWRDVADAFVLESDLWWHKGNYDQSIRCHETAVFFDPSYVDAYSSIAWLQWSMGRHGEAISTYRRCIAANPKSWEAHQALAEYYWGHKQKQIAVKYYQQAADLGSPPIPRRALGHAYRELGYPEKAVQVWRDILKLDPNDPIARRELARAGM